MGGSRCGIGVEDKMKFLDCYGCVSCAGVRRGHATYRYGG